jgi:hypothetical protein
MLQAIILCWALLAGAVQAAVGAVGPDIGEPERDLARKIVAACKAVDTEALGELVDFERRAAERLAFGTGTSAWADLDELARLVEQHATTKRWIDDGQGFNRHVTLVDLVEMQDPDAGRGAVPDRRILRASFFSQVDGLERQLLLSVTADLRLLDIVQSAPYYPGANPRGEAGLLPQSRMKLDLVDGVVWPDDVREIEREGLGELRDRLLTLRDGPDRNLVIEQLHRNPHAAVATLMDALVLLDIQLEPDAEAQALLGEVLTHITGRKSGLRAGPELGVAVAAWRVANRRAVESWLRWQVENHSSFLPTTIDHPIDPTIAEKLGEARPLPLARWSEKLREQVGGISTVPAPPVPPAPVPPAPVPPTPPAGGPADAPDGRDPGPAMPLPLSIKQTKRDILFPPAAEFRFIFGEREVTGREVEQKLPASLKAALNDWAEPATRLGLRVIVSGNPEAIVVGSARPELLRQCARWIDDSWSVLNASIPRLDGVERVATVALIMDQESVRSDTWNELIDILVDRQQLFGGTAEMMRQDVQGLLRRNVPFFIQPTWDITGEGEFQLANEVAHKFAQCLLTSRAGQQPPTVLWGFGALVEIKLFKTVYQLNDTGFVASADHFDWPLRTRYWLDKHHKKRDFSLAELALQSQKAGLPSDAQMATWAVLAWLQDKQPAGLANLLRELAELHAAGDPSHRAAIFRGDPDETLLLLQRRFDVLDVPDLVEWLDALD